MYAFESRFFSGYIPRSGTARSYGISIFKELFSEVAAPIYDEDIKNRVRGIFNTTMSDTEKGKLLNNKGKYSNRRSGKNSINSQELFYQEAYKASESADVIV